MRRFLQSLGVILVFTGCGGGGSVWDGGGVVDNDRATASVKGGQEPTRPATDPVIRSGPVTCTGESIATPLDLYEPFQQFLCGMAARCEGASSVPINPLSSISGSCSDLFESVDKLDVSNEKPMSGLCRVFSSVVDALHRRPDCNPSVSVDFCVSEIEQCFGALNAIGCGWMAMDESDVPATCVAVSKLFNTSEDEPAPVQPDPPTRPDVNAACQECLSACQGDAECMQACAVDGPCQ